MVAAITAAAQAKAQGLITLRDLCDEVGVDPANARIRLRQANIKTTGGAYVWAKDSDELRHARDVLPALRPVNALVDALIA